MFLLVPLIQSILPWLLVHHAPQQLAPLDADHADTHLPPSSHLARTIKQQLLYLSWLVLHFPSVSGGTWGSPGRRAIG